MKRIIKGIILIIVLISGFNVYATTKKESQQAIVNSAYAYYYRGKAIQYDSKNMVFQAKAKKKQRNGGIYENKEAKNTFFSPEEATSQDNQYTVCSSFVLNAIYEAFTNTKDKKGYTLKDKNGNYIFVTQSMIEIGNPKSDNYNKKIVAYYNDNLATLKKNKDVQGMKKVYKEILDTLEPGDIIVRTTKSGGHAILYIGNYFTLESGGDSSNKESDDDSNFSKYDFLKKSDNVEPDGTIKLRKLKKYSNWDEFSYSKAESGVNTPKNLIGGSIQRIIIIRVSNDVVSNSDWKLSSNATNRKKYSRLSMLKVASSEKYASVDYNDSITYTITIKNNSKENYKNIPVKDKIPSGTTLESMTTSYNGKISGDNLSWSVDIPSKKSVTITYKVKINNTNKYGSYIINNNTTVNGIKLNTIKTLVSKKVETTTREKIGKLKSGNKYKNTSALLNDLYVGYNFPDAKNIINKLFTIKSVTNKWSKSYAIAKGKDKVNTYQLKSTVNENDQYLMNMYVDGFFGGLFTYTEKNPNLYDNRIMTITVKSFSVGDVLLVVDGSYKDDSNLGIYSEYSTYVYIGGSKLATVTDGKLKILNVETSKKLIDSLLGQDLFIVLRPSKAYRPVDPYPDVEVKSISLNKKELSLKIGESELLIATITPDNATDKSVTWTSSNDEVAAVSNGLVIGTKEGTATITVKSSNGKTATCTVHVTKNNNNNNNNNNVNNNSLINNKVLLPVLGGLIVLLIISIAIYIRKNKNSNKTKEDIDDDFNDELDNNQDDDDVNDDNYFY